MPTRRFERAQPVFRWILVAILGLHAAAAFTQAILAGAYLSGSLDAMTMHRLLGGMLTLITMAQAVPALLFWYPGRGPWWPLAVTVVLFPVEGMQVGFGYARDLGLHIPLGVAIIVTVTTMFIWSLRYQPEPRTRP
ncbi:hypothetical protein [Arthrobacter castelli]|uniref:hypothetical protein n=1 Tax=Arthrobacter castelli TaxID=271431 RepID=UPI000410F258|nr:hypothetical protein [Arthrobacter castelli]